MLENIQSTDEKLATPIAVSPASTSTPKKTESPRRVELTITDKLKLESEEIVNEKLHELNLASVTSAKAKELRVIMKDKRIFPRYDKEHDAFFMSETVFKLDSMLWKFILILIELSGKSLFFYKGENDNELYNPNGNATDDFFVGLILGANEPVRANLVLKKNAITQGKACAFALKLKSWFEIHHLSAL